MYHIASQHHHEKFRHIDITLLCIIETTYNILYNEMSKSYLLLTCLIIISSSYSVGQPPLLIIISASSSKTASTIITKKSIHKGKECIISLSFDFVIFMSFACLVTFYSLELDEMHCVFWYIIPLYHHRARTTVINLSKGCSAVYYYNYLYFYVRLVNSI